ncbi:hypothetical protein JQ553_24355 [Bradyrhizobium lablabi]|nr:hypothetical protein [Bradyrhizobium lablabi]
MRKSKLLLSLGLLAAAAIVVPQQADARGGVRAGGGARVAHVGGGPGWHGGGGVRPGWHGGGARWAGGGRYYRGGGYYGGGGWGWPAAAAAGVAAGAALGAAAAYGSCYQTQQVWNGYTYVPQTVRVC